MENNGNLEQQQLDKILNIHNEIEVLIADMSRLQQEIKRLKGKEGEAEKSRETIDYEFYEKFEGVCSNLRTICDFSITQEEIEDLLNFKHPVKGLSCTITLMGKNYQLIVTDPYKEVPPQVGDNEEVKPSDWLKHINLKSLKNFEKTLSLPVTMRNEIFRQQILDNNQKRIEAINALADLENELEELRNQLNKCPKDNFINRILRQPGLQERHELSWRIKALEEQRNALQQKIRELGEETSESEIPARIQNDIEKYEVLKSLIAESDKLKEEYEAAISGNNEIIKAREAAKKLEELYSSVKDIKKQLSLKEEDYKRSLNEIYKTPRMLAVIEAKIKITEDPDLKTYLNGLREEIIKYWVDNMNNTKII